MASAPVYTDVILETKVEERAVPQRIFGHIASLDGLRALAVLVVMGYHHYLHFLPGGNVGVDVFFVLSGFLITSLLLGEWNNASRISLRSFYGRRALRLLPALLGLLSVTEMFALLRLHNDFFWSVQKAIAGALFYAANWMRVIDINSMGPLPHTWSLSVEEQFYVFWPPILIMLLCHLRRREIFIALLLASTFVAVHRMILWTGEGSWHRIYNGTDTRFDELLTGCLVAFIFNAVGGGNRVLRQVLRYGCFPSAIFLGILTIRPMSHHSMCLYGWVLIELAAAIIICGLVSNPTGRCQRILATQPLVWVGQISYGLYLWHFPIFTKLEQLHLPDVTKTFVMFGSAFAVAALSYHFVEKPFLRLKSRFQPSTPALATGRSFRNAAEISLSIPEPLL
jgi:peptidoglycan/LPS O-acetylase OafA/YrhL